MSGRELDIFKQAINHASDFLKRRWPQRYIGKPVLGIKTVIDDFIEMKIFSPGIKELTREDRRISLCHWYLSRVQARPKGREKNEDFYKSPAWKKIRFSVLSQSNGCCSLCGASAKDGICMHVDHIKPRSKYPDLELEARNLQVLCADCNIAKSNSD